MVQIKHLKEKKAGVIFLGNYLKSKESILQSSKVHFLEMYLCFSIILKERYILQQLIYLEYLLHSSQILNIILTLFWHSFDTKWITHSISSTRMLRWSQTIFLRDKFARDTWQTSKSSKSGGYADAPSVTLRNPVSRRNVRRGREAGSDEGWSRNKSELEPTADNMG